MYRPAPHREPVHPEGMATPAATYATDLHAIRAKKEKDEAVCSNPGHSQSHALQVRLHTRT